MAARGGNDLAGRVLEGPTENPVRPFEFRKRPVRRLAASGCTMVLKIRNVLAMSDARARVEEVVRGALALCPGEFEAVITHGVDLAHAEVLILEHGQWRAAYCADLRRAEHEIEIGLVRVLSAAS